MPFAFCCTSGRRSISVRSRLRHGLMTMPDSARFAMEASFPRLPLNRKVCSVSGRSASESVSAAVYRDSWSGDVFADAVDMTSATP